MDRLASDELQMLFDEMQFCDSARPKNIEAIMVYQNMEQLKKNYPDIEEETNFFREDIFKINNKEINNKDYFPNFNILHINSSKINALL